MTIDESFYIGYISRTKGLKGEIQLYFEFDDYEELELDVVFLEINKKLVPYFVESLKFNNNKTAYVTFEDVNHIDLAKDLVSRSLYLPNSKMPERDPDDFRYKDLVGYQVVDEVHGALGAIVEVNEMPQQFIAAVDMEGKELLFPLSDDLIRTIDPIKKAIQVHLPEGLVSLYKE